jgi:PPE-repeat protein
MVSTTGLGNAAVAASVGRAPTLGVLSVPQGWASAAPAFSQVGSVAPSAGAGVGATPAVAASAANPGMFPPPLANLAAREGAPLGSTARFDVRPTVVQRPVAAG